MTSEWCRSPPLLKNIPPPPIWVEVQSSIHLQFLLRTFLKLFKAVVVVPFGRVTCLYILHVIRTCCRWIDPFPNRIIQGKDSNICASAMQCNMAEWFCVLQQKNLNGRFLVPSWLPYFLRRNWGTTKFVILMCKKKTLKNADSNFW